MVAKVSPSCENIELISAISSSDRSCAMQQARDVTSMASSQDCIKHHLKIVYVKEKRHDRKMFNFFAGGIGLGARYTLSLSFI